MEHSTCDVECVIILFFHLDHFGICFENYKKYKNIKKKHFVFVFVYMFDHNVPKILGGCMLHAKVMYL